MSAGFGPGPCLGVEKEGFYLQMCKKFKAHSKYTYHHGMLDKKQKIKRNYKWIM